MSVTIPLALFALFLVGMFASGYGFGNLVEKSIVEAHEHEVDALSITIDELYEGLEKTYNVLTGDYVGEEQAREAVERAEFLLTVVMSPDKVAAAAENG